MVHCKECLQGNLVGTIFCEHCGADLLVPGEMEEFFQQPVSGRLPPGPFLQASADTTVREAVRMMNEKGSGSVVVTENGELRGLFTERDLLMRLTSSNGVALDQPLAEVMTKDLVTLSDVDTIGTAVNQMALGRFRHLPVANLEGKLEGIYSVREVIRTLYELRLAE
jgi:signal-transduction protein with cAMP-binding, CBS, and nucleotidyltransferase domain